MFYGHPVWCSGTLVVRDGGPSDSLGERPGYSEFGEVLTVSSSDRCSHTRSTSTVSSDLIRARVVTWPGCSLCACALDLQESRDLLSEC